MLWTIALAAAVPLAFAVDRWLGEPPVRWHPVVWMGNYLGWAGRCVQRHTRQLPQADAGCGSASPEPSLSAMHAPDYAAFWLGATAWTAGAAAVWAAAEAAQQSLIRLALLVSPIAAWGTGQGAWSAYAVALVVAMAVAVVMGFLLKPLFAWALLRKEVQAVEHALSNPHSGSLQAGRERLRWLVSRDVSVLGETQVRESAIETLAENLNDSVVAPVFWFVLLGLPGAALFRFANTADAMWGYPGAYQGRNWQWAGKWAARADDVLGWVPARITALLLAAVSGGQPWVRLRTEARRTLSPNSGWPMAAMALALNVRLAKPGGYVLHANGQAAAAPHMQQAIGYAARAVRVLACLAPPLLILINTMGLQ